MVKPASTDTTAIFRILDANLDRAREGLRIVEEWFRFGLNHAELAARCKEMRQTLAQWHHDELRAARDTPNDVGTSLSHPQEESRTDLNHLLRANLCRVEEALRVLEEYAKLYKTEMAIACKQMRYQVYTLESQLFSPQLKQRLEKARLYLVTSPHEKLLAVTEAALQGGVEIVQYRDKETPDEQRFANAIALKKLCDRYHALFLVNDRVDLALAVDADGVHLGQTDLPIATARQLLGPDKIIGRSTTNPTELEKALSEGADYVGIGPVYETPTKPGKAAAGHSYVSHARENCPVPWFAIGSIDTENLGEVLAAGAERVAVVRALMQSEDPTLTAQFFAAQLHRQQTLQNLEEATA
ncbi:thiamine phosphate synthase [Picosynechococcus sp. PCC 7117]|uniref:thiamine phosphate synthase n=1 Tax=Picosynechococcus sp. PCC 7117 TaxID=195498 RepID=UPI0008104B33|nr:thiamine phosphate synthase [Picosynechococcus sp. PCC 7117]ANV86248.1 thiamine-phosphate diphosphorylase [Picosynechococcus sp. PCC 7117]